MPFLVTVMCLVSSFSQAGNWDKYKGNPELWELEYKVSRTSIFHALSQCGIEKVGHLNLRVLEAAIEPIVAKIHRGTVIRDTQNLRSTCVYTSGNDGPIVLCNVDDFQNSTDIAEFVLPFHESCRSAGVPDENYEISLGLVWLAGLGCRESKAALQTSIIDPFLRLEPKLLIAGGGSSLTGGGGDAIAVTAKYLSLYFSLVPVKRISEWKRNHPNIEESDVTAAILSARFETNPDSTSQDILLPQPSGSPIIYVPQSFLKSQELQEKMALKVVHYFEQSLAGRK